MSENKALVDALVKFQRWCDAGGLDLYDQLATRESELAEANAEIERLRAEASRARKSLDVMRRGTCNLVAAEAYAHALEITREIVHRDNTCSQ